MKRGFMKWVRDYISSFPGLTAEEYAEDALGYEYSESDANDSIESLATTLHKQVRQGNEPRIKREKIGGKYRFFPATGISTLKSSQNFTLKISLSNQESQDIETLVAKGQFHNIDEAIEWLVKGCIALKSCDLGYYLGYPYWH